MYSFSLSSIYTVIFQCITIIQLSVSLIAQLSVCQPIDIYLTYFVS